MTKLKTLCGAIIFLQPLCFTAYAEAGELSVNSVVQYINQGSKGSSLVGNLYNQSLDYDPSVKIICPGVTVQVYHKYGDGTAVLLGELVTDANGKINGPSFTRADIGAFNVYFRIVMETSLARVAHFATQGQTVTYETPVLKTDVQSFSDTITVPLSPENNENGSANALTAISQIDSWMKEHVSYTSIDQIPVIQKDSVSDGLFDPAGWWALFSIDDRL